MKKLHPTLIVAGVLVCQLYHLAAQTIPPRADKDHAVFFAISKYQHPELPELPNSVKDARAIAGVLENRFGFKTDILENPKKDEIDRMLDKLVWLYRSNADGQHPPEGQLFLFFSGRSVSNNWGHGYFPASDHDPAIFDWKSYAYQILERKIAKINCRHILVVIDAPKALDFLKWKDEPDDIEHWGSMLNSHPIPTDSRSYTSRIFFTSDNSQDSTTERSGFVRKMLEGLQSANLAEGILTSQHLFSNYIAQAVPKPHADVFADHVPGGAFIFYDLEWMKKNAPSDTSVDTARVRRNAPALAEDGLILIKGGTFVMGCSSEQLDCSKEEKPEHKATVSDFYLGQYEVTQQQWKEIMGDNPSFYKNCNDCPVEQVRWTDVQEFLSKLNTKYPGRHYRLPTETEWEYAAREGGKPILFGNGKNIADTKEINFDGNNDEYFIYAEPGEERWAPVPVGSLNSPNALGLYDMSGNVSEWCSDWYGPYALNNAANPSGATSGIERVTRGGSYLSLPRSCRVASRGLYNPYDRFVSIGFRLARSK